MSGEILDMSIVIVIIRFKDPVPISNMNFLCKISLILVEIAIYEATFVK